MKIKVLLGLLLSFTIFFTALAGCSSNNNTQGTQSGTKNTQSRLKGNYKSPSLMGQVSEIAGNDVTLKLIKVPQIFSGAGGSSRSYQNGASGVSRSTSGYQQGASRAQRVIDFTGEVKELIIPVGTKIVTTAFSQSGVSQSTVTFATIKKGDTLSVYYAADGKTIDQISVSSASSARGLGRGSFNGGAGGGTNGGGN